MVKSDKSRWGWATMTQIRVTHGGRTDIAAVQWQIQNSPDSIHFHPRLLPSGDQLECLVSKSMFISKAGVYFSDNVERFTPFETTFFFAKHIFKVLVY